MNVEKCNVRHVKNDLSVNRISGIMTALENRYEKRDAQIRRKTTISVFIICVIFIGLMIFNGLAASYTIHRQGEDQLSEMTDQSAAEFDSLNDQAISALRIAAAMFSDGGYYSITDKEEMVEKLNIINRSSYFEDVSYIDRNGITLTDKGGTYDDREYEYYQRGIQGQSGYSVVLFSNISIRPLIVYYVPVMKPDGETEGVLIGYHNSNIYDTILNKEVFGNPSKAFICYGPEGAIVEDSDGIKDYGTLKEYFIKEGLLDDDKCDVMDEVFSGRSDSAGFRYTEEGGAARAQIRKVDDEGLYIIRTYPAMTFSRFLKDQESLMRTEFLILALLVMINLKVFLKKQRENQEKNEIERYGLEAILEGTQMLFSVSAYANLKDDIYNVIDYNEKYDRDYPKTGKFSEAAKYFADYYVDGNINKPLSKLFTGDAISKIFADGRKSYSCEFMYKNDPTQWGSLHVIHLKTYRNNSDMYLLEIMDISEARKRTDEQKWITELIHGGRQIFVSEIDLNSGNIMIKDTGLDVLRCYVGTWIPYDKFISKVEANVVVPEEREHYIKIASLKYVEKVLEQQDQYEPAVNMLLPSGLTSEVGGFYRFIDKEKGRVLCVAEDITKLTEHDFVTGLYSENGFKREVYPYYYHGEKSEYAILCFNMENFKLINDQYGFETGDEVLKEIGKHLTDGSMIFEAVCRAKDDIFYCFARKKDLDYQKLEELCTWPGKVIDHTLSLKCGVVPVRENTADTVATVMDKALMAEQQVKGENKTKPYYIYDEKIKQMYDAQYYITQHLQAAIDEGCITAYYQPVIDASTGKIASAEALVRWIDDSKGVISPGMFVPSLEKAGKISILDLVMIEQVIRFQEKRISNGLPTVPVAVNLSRYDVNNNSVIDKIIDMMKELKFDHRLIRFEITESAFMDISDESRRKMQVLNEMGHDLLIDDFGTGYSTYESIIEQKYEILKVDISFVRKIGNSRTEAAITSIIDFAHDIGMKTVAEGVETKTQYEFLKEKGCDYIQGFYFSKPEPEKVFEEVYLKV